jgi:hypothetical protein
MQIRGNRRTDRNNWTKVQTRGRQTFSSCLCLCSFVFICACVFLLYVPLFNCFYLCVCFPLVCTFVQKGTNKRKTHAQIKTIEQRYIQEENTRTYKNNVTKVQTRGIHTHRYKQWNNVHLFNSFYLYVCFPLVCTFVQMFLSVTYR